ncbi:hypothetical protein HZF24_01530 [Sedimentibacter hydroxybenzoicus DSM 7310]|uniref:Tetratricopeptide repeat-containing protein n=1 Tax=Sedimentibacter hydroxybenzoicus DSM 7310 TaxID=1123245 RepID=A0A974GUY4_SEDHY|nr:hypothetical protein [Sedimentibacter hydroxybenzoicus]NYB72816.1 hypothetical protein [Sedimentibacter hydroxybenzoicus DSM 7310]
MLQIIKGNPDRVIVILSIVIPILIALMQTMYRSLKIREKINNNIRQGILYRSNNKIEEARKEFNKVFEYENKKIFKGLVINAKINFYETYNHDMINREKSLEYARVHEEELIKKLPNYQARKSLLFSKYKYQYAILCSNLGFVYNELALIRDAKSNYGSSKKYSLQAIDTYKKINRVNSYYFSTYGTVYSNLSITYRGLANMNKNSMTLQLSLNNAEKSLSIYEEMKDFINIARVQNNIGNIYSDFIRYKNDKNEREKNYSNSEKYLHKSLEFYNIEKYPYEFARSYQNLGSLNLLMMCNDDDKDKIYSYYIKSEKNYEMCKKVFVKDKYENEYINLYYNLMSLYFNALKRIGDMNLLSKIMDTGKFILDICTIENRPKIYVDTNNIIADAYKFTIETCEFTNESEKIDFIEETIAKYEIVLGFREFSISDKANLIINITRLNMTLLDMTGLIIYEEKCNYYCKELNEILKVHPEVLNDIEDFMQNGY